MIDKYYKLHSSCFIVKGISIGNIYDLRRGSIFFLPNSILDLLENYASKKISTLLNDYNNQLELINKYLDFLIENEIIFFTNDLDHFPKISMSFRKPFRLDIVLMEIDNFDSHKKNIFQDDMLSEIGCTELVLISQTNATSNLEKILKTLDKSKIQSVIYLTDYKDYKPKKVSELTSNYLRLREVLIYNSPKITDKKSNNIIIFENNNIEDLLMRKIKSINDLVPNLEVYIEAQKHNIFYNRRIYIDNENRIKHTINQKETYGNISNENIFNIILDKNFNYLWNITKDDIIVCKDCQFRYLCPDNRIPIYDEKNKKYYHIEECNYNPYTNQWK